MINSIADLRNTLLFSFDLALDNVMNRPRVRKELIELNQKEQLQEGIDATGKRIRTISAEEQGGGNVYSLFTINERNKKGLQINNVNLRDTGAFWNTFRVVNVSNGWDIVADYDIHSSSILDNFDKKYDFTGLTAENLDYFVNMVVLPELKIEVRRLLGL